jgi:hypothetical protein
MMLRTRFEDGPDAPRAWMVRQDPVGSPGDHAHAPRGRICSSPPAVLGLGVVAHHPCIAHACYENTLWAPRSAFSFFAWRRTSAPLKPVPQARPSGFRTYGECCGVARVTVAPTRPVESRKHVLGRLKQTDEAVPLRVCSESFLSFLPPTRPASLTLHTYMKSFFGNRCARVEMRGQDLTSNAASAPTYGAGVHPAPSPAWTRSCFR